MSKVEELVEFCKVAGLRVGGMTLGSRATPEAVAEEMLACLTKLEAGDFEIIAEIGE